MDAAEEFQGWLDWNPSPHHYLDVRNPKATKGRPKDLRWKKRHGYDKKEDRWYCGSRLLVPQTDIYNIVMKATKQAEKNARASGQREIWNTVKARYEGISREDVVEAIRVYHKHALQNQALCNEERLNTPFVEEEDVPDQRSHCHCKQSCSASHVGRQTFL